MRGADGSVQSGRGGLTHHGWGDGLSGAAKADDGTGDIHHLPPVSGNTVLRVLLGVYLIRDRNLRHYLIVVGTNEADMAAAANRICHSDGNVVVVDGAVVAEMPLPIAGLMTELSGEEIAVANEMVREAVYELGVPKNVKPFMNMAFVSLPVIPLLKMITQGLVNVDRQERISLYAEKEYNTQKSWDSMCESQDFLVFCWSEAPPNTCLKLKFTV